jgi:RNA polymerase sigma-70 factor (ECF subfamily)
MGRVMAEDAFEVVVATHHAEIHRYVARVTARSSDADDLSQEIFIRAFRAHKALPPDANCRAWLFAIATNVCRNYFRGEKRRRLAYAAAGNEASVADPVRPDGRVLVDEASNRIDQIVAGLPMKQRLAFTMRKMHDLDYEAIGKSLECSEESARAHVFQALKKIRQGLDGLASAHTEPAR